MSSDLEEICLKCLERDREKRWATAHELAAALRGHHSSSATSPTNSVASSHVLAALRRKRLPFQLVVSAAVALVLASLSLVFFSRRQTSSTDARIGAALESDIYNDSRLRRDNIHVTVRNGVVTLTGQVDNELDRVRADSIAGAREGVRQVIDDLRVRGEPLPNLAPTPRPPAIQLFRPQVNGLWVLFNGVTWPKTQGARITSISWSFGDGTPSSTSQFPVNHAFAHSGTFLVTAVASDSNGLTTSATTNVTVGGASGGDMPEVTSEGQCTGLGDTRVQSKPLGRIQILSGTGTFAGISPGSKSVTVESGRVLRGTIALSVLNRGPGFAVAPLIETPSWGDPRTSWRSIENLRPGGSTHNVQIDEAAPLQEGTYHIVFAFQLEMSGGNVASGTNWARHRDVWGDGNDIAQFNSSRFSRPNNSGVRSIPGSGRMALSRFTWRQMR